MIEPDIPQKTAEEAIFLLEYFLNNREIKDVVLKEEQKDKDLLIKYDDSLHLIRELEEYRDKGHNWTDPWEEDD
jgi:hypothetical protein